MLHTKHQKHGKKMKSYFNKNLPESPQHEWFPFPWIDPSLPLVVLQCTLWLGQFPFLWLHWQPNKFLVEIIC